MSELRLIYKKIPAIMAEVGAIEKSRRGENISYRFRGIDDIYMALQPLFAKHGVFVVPKVLNITREERTTKAGGTLTFSILTVEYTFYAEDGSSVTAIAAGEAMDTSDKSSNKAMSAALKYVALQTFCIPTEEEKDTEYQNHEPAPRPSEMGQVKTFPQKAAPVSEFASPAQVGRLQAIAKKVGMPPEDLKRLALSMGVQSSQEIPKNKYEALCSTVEAWNK